MHGTSLQALQAIRAAAPHGRVVFVSGNFNIIHPGHLRLLRFAKECGDFLVVGILDSRTSAGAFVDEALRLESVRAISWVDFAFVLSDPPEEFVGELKPASVIKGREHEKLSNPEAPVVEGYGGKLLFGSGDIVFSSMDLIRQEWQKTNPTTIKKPDEYLERHEFDYADLTPILEQLPQLRICVIGDAIVDEYVTCEPLGMSQEDPTIVVTPLHHQRFTGGAGIVAAHARGLGAKVHYFTVVGKDATAQFVRSSMEGYGVRLHCYEDESRPTTLKQRFRASQKTLLRVSHLRQHAISQSIGQAIYEDVLGVLDETDLFIFSDFNYGCLPNGLVNRIAAECGRRKISMVADSQSSSQVGDISRFKNMMLITPTEREARLALRDFESGLVGLAERLKQKSNARHIIVTLGSEGILIHADIDDVNFLLTDRLPALNTAPKDVAGAGDSFLTTASMALAKGADIWKSACLGSLAAACQVGRVGNIPLTADDLKREIMK